MKPYYDEGGITIYHADCREVLLMEDFSVDLVLTDPPYSLSVRSNHENRRGKGTRRLDFFTGDQDWSTMTKAVVDRVTLAAAKAPAAYIWCGHRQFGAIVDALEGMGFATRFLVWKKLCPVPAPPGVGWDSAAELCVYAFRSGRKWTPPTGTKVPNIIAADSYRHGQPGKVDHPTQKPLPIARVPLLYSARPGDMVLDPFMGSGTTLRAAKDLGMRAIGIEIEERYCEIAARRLGQEVFDFGDAA